MLLFVWSADGIKSIKQKFKTKNIYNFNKTCSNVRMWGLDINQSKWTTIENVWAENIKEKFLAQYKMKMEFGESERTMNWMNL